MSIEEMISRLQYASGYLSCMSNQVADYQVEDVLDIVESMQAVSGSLTELNNVVLTQAAHGSIAPLQKEE